MRDKLLTIALSGIVFILSFFTLKDLLHGKVTSMVLAHSEPAEVVFDGSSYNPLVVNLEYGGTVRFVNRSLNEITDVSSDPHPGHNIYPALNIGQILPGAEKSLTFNDSGTFPYHDHLHANIRGTIIVAKVPSTQVVSQSSGNDNDMRIVEVILLFSILIVLVINTIIMIPQRHEHQSSPQNPV